MASIEKRTSENGNISYRVKVRIKGHPVETATFERKTDATKWAASIESAIKEGRHFKTTESKKRILGELIDLYIKNELPKKPKNARNQNTQLLWWRDEIGSYALADVTPSLIANCRDKLSEGLTPNGKQRSPATVVRYLAALSICLTYGVKEKGWIDDNPMSKVTKPTEPRGRVRFLSADERTRLLKACRDSESPYLYPVLLLALSTGARYGEIMNLTWDDIDLSRGRAILHETKNGERRAIPIVGLALDVIKELNKVRRIDTKLLFAGNNPNKPTVIRKHWDKALKEAGIENFRFHDSRHSAASELAMNGATLAEIAEILGHKTLAMVQRYAHLSEGHTAGVVERMNKKIFGE
jgi:integrase